MNGTDALKKFAARLHPTVLADIEGWEGDPLLGKLHATLTHHAGIKSFLDTCAEALVARHLLGRGCGLGLEVPTPNGKACDLEVVHGTTRFFLHVKRLDGERPVRKRLTISSRLRSLERINRPYVVSVRWQERASDADMERLVREAGQFIRDARVGEELAVSDDGGREIGGVLILAPWEGPFVSLVIGLPSGFIDETPRIRRLLRRAYRQFMPKAANLTLLCSSHSEDVDDFASALLGSHVERWDAFPPRGRRIAHGRANDGLWHGGRYVDSRVAGWFLLTPHEASLRVRLLFREHPPVDDEVRATLAKLFDDAGGRV